MKAAVKPRTTEWIDERHGPPFVEFTFHYRSKGFFSADIELIIDKLVELGFIPDVKVSVKDERSEYSTENKGESSTASGKKSLFWSFWGK